MSEIRKPNLPGAKVWAPDNIQIFAEYFPPNGYLPRVFRADDPDVAAHCLFRYYMSAIYTYVTIDPRNNPMVLTGVGGSEVDPAPPNYREIFKSWCQVYGVQPRQATAYWTEVDMTVDIIGIDRLPNTDEFRHTSIPEVRIQ